MGRDLRWVGAVLLSAAVGACDSPGEPGGSIPAPPVPKKGGYSVVAIDSADMTFAGLSGFPSPFLFAATLTDKGEVLGVMSGGGATYRYRWTNGSFRLSPAAGALQLKAGNSRGDLVGTNGPSRPIVWYLDDPGPTPLFPFDTAVAAIDINDWGEILLSPAKEYRPGASVWLNGTSKPVDAAMPLAPGFLTDSGLVWVTSRGTLVDSSWFAPSPFRRSATFHPACPATPARQVIGGERRSLRLLSFITFSDTTHYYIDDGVTCRNISVTGAPFRPDRLIEEGYAAGTVYLPNATGEYRVPWPGISNGVEAVALRDLPAALSEWSLDTALSMNSSGTILVFARKMSGYGQGKSAYVLLVPR